MSAGRLCVRCRLRDGGIAHRLDVDARFSEIGAVAGKGSQARRAELVSAFFGQATDAEQTFLRRLLGGELRQGALLGVMADAVAKRPTSRSRGRRAAMLGGYLPAVAAAALTAGEAALDQFTLRSASPSVRCSRRPLPASPRRSNVSAVQRFSRPSWTGRECRFTVPATPSGSTREASTTSPPATRGVEATLALPVTDLIADARRSHCGPTAVPTVSRSPRPGSAVRSTSPRPGSPATVGVRLRPLHLDGADLLDLPTSEPVAALDAIVPASHRVDRLITDDA